MATGELVTRAGITLSAKIRTTVITYTSASGGPFTYRETVTGGTSGATGVVLRDATADSELLVAVTSGTFQDAETITGGTSGATATTSGTPAVGWPTSFVTIARVRDNFNVGQNRQQQELVDFDTGETDYADQIAGIQSGDANFTLNLVPGGESFQLLEAAYDYNKEINIKRVQTDRDEANTRTLFYTGVQVQFSETDAVNDVATAQVNVALSDKTRTDPT